jgi:hypothetical protein
MLLNTIRARNRSQGYCSWASIIYSPTKLQLAKELCETSSFGPFGCAQQEQQWLFFLRSGCGAIWAPEGHSCGPGTANTLACAAVLAAVLVTKGSRPPAVLAVARAAVFALLLQPSVLPNRATSFLPLLRRGGCARQEQRGPAAHCDSGRTGRPWGGKTWSPPPMGRLSALQPRGWNLLRVQGRMVLHLLFLAAKFVLKNSVELAVKKHTKVI